MAYIRRFTSNNTCLVCYSDLETDSQVTTPQGCVSCSDCLKSWLITQTQELYFRVYGKFSCFNTNCKEKFTIDEVFSKFGTSEQEEINAALLIVYINKTDDIRRCPNQSCSYSGVINTNESCKLPFECAMCRTTWREKAQISSMEKTVKFYSKDCSQRNELMNELWEEICARRCPNCYVSIEKVGGCNHMKCGKCQHSFCWLCTQSEEGHNSDRCMISVSTKFLIILLPLLQIFMLIGLEKLVAWLFVWMSALIMNGLILNAFLISIYMIFKSGFSGCIVNKLFSFVPFFMILFIINSLNLQYSLLKAGLIEMVGLGVLVFGRFSINKWLKKIR